MRGATSSLVGRDAEMVLASGLTTITNQPLNGGLLFVALWEKRLMNIPSEKEHPVI